jgi:hypothetical protein
MHVALSTELTYRVIFSVYFAGFLVIYRNMLMSRGEIQHGYRRRKKKKEGTKFLQAEHERVNEYYIPSIDLSRSQQIKRNETKH